MWFFFGKPEFRFLIIMIMMIAFRFRDGGIEASQPVRKTGRGFAHAIILRTYEVFTSNESPLLHYNIQQLVAQLKLERIIVFPRCYRTLITVLSFSHCKILATLTPPTTTRRRRRRRWEKMNRQQKKKREKKIVNVVQSWQKKTLIKLQLS